MNTNITNVSLVKKHFDESHITFIRFMNATTITNITLVEKHEHNLKKHIHTIHEQFEEIYSHSS